MKRIYATKRFETTKYVNIDGDLLPVRHTIVKEIPIIVGYIDKQGRKYFRELTQQEIDTINNTTL